MNKTRKRRRNCEFYIRLGERLTLYCGILGLKVTVFWHAGYSAYLIYGDPVVCLFSVFASLKYVFFESYSATTKLLRIELSWC